MDAGTSYNSYTGSLGHQSGTFDFARAQVEEGEAATDFEVRHLQQELVMCQRYYEKSFDQGTTPGTNLGIGGAGEYMFGIPSPSSTMAQVVWMKTTKRATPTLQTYDGAGNAGVVTADVTLNGGRSFLATGDHCFQVSSALICSTFRFHYTASAEL